MKKSLKNLGTATGITAAFVLACWLVQSVVGGVIGGNLYLKNASVSQLTKSTAMITRMDGRSGGTGVVIKSTDTESKILTNAHVCGVVKNGGTVRTERASASVTSYQVSNLHDLCLITVNQNLHVNTEVSNEAPNVYDNAKVSGHPNLLPSIVTTGHFSHKEIVTVMTGMKPCTKEDAEGPAGLLCLFLGGIPQLKNYEAQVISATIMPGSSGSAVFNDDGEIAGLVFAGSGNFGFGLIVPQEYVSEFVHHEVFNLPVEKPNTMVDLVNTEQESKAKLKQACLQVALGNPEYAPFEKYCQISSDLIY